MGHLQCSSSPLPAPSSSLHSSPIYLALLYCSHYLDSGIFLSFLKLTSTIVCIMFSCWFISTGPCCVSMGTLSSYLYLFKSKLSRAAQSAWVESKSWALSLNVWSVLFWAGVILSLQCSIIWARILFMSLSLV